MGFEVADQLDETRLSEKISLAPTGGGTWLHTWWSTNRKTQLSTSSLLYAGDIVRDVRRDCDSDVAKA